MEKKKVLAKYIYDNVSAGQCRKCNISIRTKPADMMADDIIAILDNTVSKSAFSEGLGAEMEELKELAKELLAAAEKCGQAPHYIVQPFWNIVKKHANTISKYDLLRGA